MDYAVPFPERLAALGERARRLRLLQQMRQAELAERAGVGVATVQRFEKTGTASIENVLRMAHVLRADAAFDLLFVEPEFRSIDDAIGREKANQRQRAPRPK
jgi:transcriptional regulator with XRE-family HTH domain